MVAESDRTEVMPADGVTDSQLAVLFRQLRWALDDAAHDFPDAGPDRETGRAVDRRRECGRPQIAPMLGPCSCCSREP